MASNSADRHGLYDVEAKILCEDSDFVTATACVAVKWTIDGFSV
jgi:hypothetical protein